MTLNIQPKREDAIMKSPEFLTEFNKVCEGLGVEGLDVPEQWGDDITAALSQFSFSELQRICQMLPQQYVDLATSTPANVLLYKLGASVILSCKPSVFGSGIYPSRVLDYSHLIDQCNAKFEEARKQAVKTIYNRELLSGKI